MSKNITLNEFSDDQNLTIIYLTFEIHCKLNLQFKSGLIRKFFVAMQTVDFVFISCFNTFMTFILIYEPCFN